MKRRLLCLTSAIVADAEALPDAIYRWLETRPGRSRRSRPILRAQRMLRSLVNKSAWAAYLALEEATNARASEELRMVARWAFAEGRSIESARRARAR